LSTILSELAASNDSEGGHTGAVRNFKHSVTMRNLATYACKIRVQTWVCRVNVPSISDVPATTENKNDHAAFESPYSDLPSLLNDGFGSPYVITPSGSNAAPATDVESSLFMNPLWVQHFKCVKTKSYTLMPFRSRRETLHCLKKRPGLIWQYGNAFDASATIGVNEGKDPGTPEPLTYQYGFQAVARMGGITTCVKTIEFVGENVTDQIPLNPPTTTPGCGTAPVVMEFKDEFEWETAQPSIYPVYQTVGSNVETLEEIQTGQPWNYLYPFASSTNSSTGYSSVSGALSGGGV